MKEHSIVFICLADTFIHSNFHYNYLYNYIFGQKQVRKAGTVSPP